MELGMPPKQTIAISGISVMDVWQPGVIGKLLGNGLSIRRAKIYAAENGHLIHHGVCHNLVVNNGLNLVGDHLISAVTNGLTYHSIGTGTTTPVVTDTHLTTEVARVAVVTKSRVANVDTFDFFYSSPNYFIKEAGVWGGTASATLGSGTLFSHYLQSYDNTSNLADITFEYQLTITGA